MEEEDPRTRAAHRTEVNEPPQITAADEQTEYGQELLESDDRLVLEEAGYGHGV